MNRKLSYTAEAFAKRVRMSKEAALFIIVEGREIDTPFYEGLAKTSPAIIKRGYQIWLIEQLTRQVANHPGANNSANEASGGKLAALALFDRYKAAGSLTSSNSMGKRSIVFCLDRDVDGVAKSLRRSPHVIYTPMADAEATLYIHGDTRKALANATSLDEASVDEFLLQNPDWATSLALLWREWIELCCLATAHRAHCHVGTTKKSAVNADFYGSLLPAEVERALAVIYRKSQLSPDKHKEVDQRVRERLRRTYTNGNACRLLGKHWLSEYLLHLLKLFAGTAPIGLTNFKHKAPTAFLSETNFNASWAERYRRSFEALV